MPSSPQGGGIDRADRLRRRRGRRRIPPAVVSTAALLAVALVDARFAMAFPSSPGQPRPIRRRPPFSPAGRPSHRAISPSSGGGMAPRRTTATGIGGGGGLRARSAQRDEEEVFQRSLLEAKIANDIKDTIIKDERQRNEVVAKQIGQVKEELQEAVQEVKEAVQEVSQSAKSLGGAVIGSASTVEAAREYARSAVNLGGAFVGSAPRIFANLVKLSATSETR
jgi:hypothetical protein